MRRAYALALPLELRGMHRFVPVTIRDLGGTIVEQRVNHRPRHAGETKYGLGITKRAIPGLIDLFAVRYFRSRRRSVAAMDIPPSNASTPQAKVVEVKPVAVGAGESSSRGGH
jgi:hypothetical protein